MCIQLVNVYSTNKGNVKSRFNTSVAQFNIHNNVKYVSRRRISDFFFLRYLSFIYQPNSPKDQT